MSEIYCACCPRPRYEFSDKEIDAMRRKLAATWHQSVSQVTDYEAVYYLRQRTRTAQGEFDGR